VDNQCVICDETWYALNVGDKCVPCEDNFDCKGGNIMNVNEGYWRDTIYQTEPLVCFNSEACLGGFYPD